MEHVGRAVFVTGVILLIVFMLTLGLSWTYGGGYYREALPLDRAWQYETLAENALPQNPIKTQVLVSDHYTRMAWTQLNQSEAAWGHGNGSPCYMNAIPSQTYGYSAGLMSSILFELHNLSLNTGHLISNTTFQQWSDNVRNLYNQLGLGLDNDGGQGQNVGSDIADCLWIGNSAAVAEFIVVIAWIPALVGISVAVSRFD